MKYGGGQKETQNYVTEKGRSDKAGSIQYRKETSYLEIMELNNVVFYEQVNPIPYNLTRYTVYINIQLPALLT